MIKGTQFFKKLSSVRLIFINLVSLGGCIVFLPMLLKWLMNSEGFCEAIRRETFLRVLFFLILSSFISICLGVWMLSYSTLLLRYTLWKLRNYLKNARLISPSKGGPASMVFEERERSQRWTTLKQQMFQLQESYLSALLRPFLLQNFCFSLYVLFRFLRWTVSFTLTLILSIMGLKKFCAFAADVGHQGWQGWIELGKTFGKAWKGWAIKDSILFCILLGFSGFLILSPLKDRSQYQKHTVEVYYSFFGLSAWKMVIEESIEFWNSATPMFKENLTPEMESKVREIFLESLLMTLRKKTLRVFYYTLFLLIFMALFVPALAFYCPESFCLWGALLVLGVCLDFTSTYALTESPLNQLLEHSSYSSVWEKTKFL